MAKKQVPIALTEQPSLQRLLTVPQVAEILGVSRGTVYVYVNTDGLPILRIGGNIRVRAASLQKWLEKKEQAS